MELALVQAGANQDVRNAQGADGRATRMYVPADRHEPAGLVTPRRIPSTIAHCSRV